MSIKLASCPGEKDIAKFPEFANPFQSMKPRKKPKKRTDYKSYNPCEQIIEVQDDGDEMDGAPRRTRWFHPKMLFDGEDELLGICFTFPITFTNQILGIGKNIQIAVAMKTHGRSKSSELIKMPKIVEGALEDDTHIIHLSSIRAKRMSASGNLFAVDLIEDELTPYAKNSRNQSNAHSRGQSIADSTRKNSIRGGLDMED